MTETLIAVGDVEDVVEVIRSGLSDRVTLGLFDALKLIFEIIFIYFLETDFLIVLLGWIVNTREKTPFHYAPDRSGA